MIKKQFDNHPIIASILTSIIATIVYTIAIEPIINNFEKLKIKLTLPFPQNNPFSFHVNLITIFFVLIMLLLLVAYIVFIITKQKTQQKVKQQLPLDGFCDNCSKTLELISQNNTQQKELENLKLRFNKALPYRKLTDCLTSFFNENDVLESLQLFSYEPLPSVDAANNCEHISISLHYEAGMSKANSNINALLNINYTFDNVIYHDIKKLFDLRNAYYSNNNNQRNANTENDIKKTATELYYKLHSFLNVISKKEDIRDTHYACYKLLEIVGNLVIEGETPSIGWKPFLSSSEIEYQLKKWTKKRYVRRNIHRKLVLLL